MITSLVVPQLGEGLREVRLIQRLKSVGESVALDEALYEVETEKAAVQVESSIAGRIVAWRYAEGDDVPVHGEIVDLESEQSEGVHKSVKPEEDREETVRPDGMRIPPRTRAFARAEGIDLEELTKMPVLDRAVQVADVIEWREALGQEAKDYADIPFSPRQRTFNRRALGDATNPVPATLRRPLAWEAVTTLQERLLQEHPDRIVSEFQILAYAAAQATRTNARFRSKWLNRETLRCFDHLDLGFAIRLPGDELTTAVIRKADTLPFPAVSAAITSGMKDAVRGKEEAPDHRTTLILSSLAAYGIVDADPLLTPPASAVLFIGAPYPTPEGAMINLVLTFDHRVMNGVGAAIFLQDIDKELSAWRAAPAGEGKHGSS
jgi:pyruvate dehydrogenase E2 component (dihydrolipoamide acetyltransferase)